MVIATINCLSLARAPLFPREFNLRELDVITQQPLIELRRMHCSKKIPEYLIAVTQVEHEKTKTYKIYDGVTFFSYHKNSKNTLDPTVNLTIQKIYYFSVDIFSKEEHLVFEPHFINEPSLFEESVFKRHKIDNFEKFQQWTFNALNPNWEEKLISNQCYTDREKIIAKVACILADSTTKHPPFKKTASLWANCAEKAFSKTTSTTFLQQ